MALKKNLLYNFLLSVSQILFPLLSIPYISRVLDAEGIGKVNITDSLTFFIVVLAELGISTYAIREVAKVKSNPTLLKKRTSELISFHILSVLIFSIIYGMAVYFLYLKFKTPTCFCLVHCFTFLLYLTVSGTIVEQKISIYFYQKYSNSFLGLLAMFWLIQSPSDFEVYYAIIVCSIVGNTILNFMQILPTFQWSLINCKQDLKNTLPVYFIGLVHSITLMLDNVILGFTSSLISVAYYSNAAKLVRISGALITDSFTVFFPRTTSLIHEKEEDKLKQMIEKTIALVWFLCIPLAVGLFVFSASFTKIYFGESLQLVYNNLLILSIYPLIKSFSLFFSRQILMSYQDDKTTLKGYILGAILFVVLAIFLGHFYQDVGCSIALLFSEIAMLVYFYIASKKYLTHIKFEVTKNLLMFLITGVLFYLIQQGIHYYFGFGITYFIITILISVCFYVFLQLILKNSLVTEMYHLMKNKFLISE